jgi:predicted metal-dependent hydrolase
MGVSFQRGIDEYLAGRHYEAHEFWEELWQVEADEDQRRFLQALIQVASAVHKAVNDVAPRGSLRLLDSATEKLHGLGDAFLGVDLAALREGMGSCRSEVARQLEAGGHCQLEAVHIPPLVQLSDAPLFRGSKNEPAVPASARQAWFDRGLATYAAGEYFDAHEMWEELWRDAPRGFDRHFVQGLIQFAAAMHKIVEQQKPKPAARLLGRALDKVADAPANYRGIDVPRLVAEGRAALSTLESTGVLTSGQVPSIVKLGT